MYCKSPNHRSFLGNIVVMLSAVCVMLLPVLMGACGPGLPGSIELVDTPNTTGTWALARLGNVLYVVDDNAKLLTYDISKPESPERTQQLDAFKGPFLGMTVAYGERRLLLVGENGKVVLYDLSDPKKPTTMWAGGKTVQMVPKTGPFMIYPSTNAIYMTPGGSDLVRIDLSVLDTGDIDGIDMSKATKKFTGTGGGGGIALMYDDKNVPVRLYVGHQDGGKLDVWLIPDLEGGKADPKPSTTVAIAGLGKINSVTAYKESKSAIQGWLLLGGDAESEKNLDVLDLGRHFKDASDPKAAFSANIGGIYRIDSEQQVIVNKKLEVWTFPKIPAAPTKVAQLALKETPNIRDMLIYKGFIYTAEEGGLRIYRFSKGTEAK